MLARGSEVRMRDHTTGGEKGKKPELFSLLPYDALDEILRAYHYGANKYSSHNWRKGYAYSLSFDAVMRHLTAWWEREDLDPESGLSHLAHAGWHVFCLLWFQLNAKGTDDRWKPEAEAPVEVPVGQEVPTPSAYGFQGLMGGGSPLAHCEVCAERLELEAREVDHPYNWGRMVLSKGETK